MSLTHLLLIHDAVYVGKKIDYLPMAHAMRVQKAGFHHTLNGICTQRHQVLR